MVVGADVDDSVRYLSGNQVVHGMLQGHGPDTVDRALTAVRDALADHAGPHGVVLSGRAWLVTARALPAPQVVVYTTTSGARTTGLSPARPPPPARRSLGRP